MSNETKYDFTELDEILSIEKAHMHGSNGSTFLASLMSQIEFHWDPNGEKTVSVATDGLNIYWNPEFFTAIPKGVRRTVLKKVLWHIALLHPVRGINLEQEYWSNAADVTVDNILAKEKCNYVGLESRADFDYLDYSTEEIYKAKVQKEQRQKGFSFGYLNGNGEGSKTNLLPPPPGVDLQEHAQQMMSNAMMAATKAKMAGNLPGEVEGYIEALLDNKVSWEELLYKFFTDLGDYDHTWKKRNRRYQDVYLPGIVEDEDRLRHIAYFLDTSGSVSDEDVKRFNTEVKYIKETFNPQRLTLIQFDTSIQQVDEFYENDEFTGLRVSGRGGTCLVCVRDWILEHQPTAAVVFSDMCVKPMQPLPDEKMIPMIWVGVSSGGRFKIPHGEKVVIN